MKIYDDLYNFYVATKSTSISTAAKKIGIDQASLSISLKRLEKKLDTTLIIRGRKGLELTDKGLLLYQKVHDQYSSINNVLSSFLKTNVEGDFQEIKILTTTGVLANILIEALEYFNQKYPDISINFQTYDGDIAFSETNADIGILPKVLDSDKVHKSKVLTLESQLFCSSGYIKKYGKPEKIEDLKDHRLIGYYNSARGYKGNVDWHLKYSLNGEADIKINHATAQLLASEKDLGIIAMPREIPMSDNMVMLLPEHKVLIDVFAITKRGFMSEKVDNFLNCVRKTTGKGE